MIMLCKHNLQQKLLYIIISKIVYLQKMSEKCYKKCIAKPGSTLDNSEQVCFYFQQKYFKLMNFTHIKMKKCENGTHKELYYQLMNNKISEQKPLIYISCV